MKHATALVAAAAIAASCAGASAQPSILDPLGNGTASVELLKARAAEQIARQSQASLAANVALYNRLMDAFWHDPVLTPQQVADALGTKAASLFILGGKLRAFLASVDPAIEAKLKNPTNKFAINPDGTVTILPEPYEAHGSPAAHRNAAGS